MFYQLYTELPWERKKESEWFSVRVQVFDVVEEPAKHPEWQRCCCPRTEQTLDLCEGWGDEVKRVLHLQD